MSEMTAGHVVELLAVLEEAGVKVWLDGGWGVDALLHRQTRTHKDLDLVVRIEAVPKLQETLGPRGFKVLEGIPPDSFVLRDANGREIDVHAVRFDECGNGLYRMQNGVQWVYPAEGFDGRGVVGGRAVDCLSPKAQIYCHAEGYEPVEKDFAEMKLIGERFGLELPPQLRT